jgi:hypothetical protein
MIDNSKIDESQVGKLQKKKTIYKASRPFPYLTTRNLVISVQDVKKKTPKLELIHFFF